MDNEHMYRPKRVADKPAREIPTPEPRESKGWASKKKAPGDWTGLASYIAGALFIILALAGIGYFLYSVIKSYGMA